MTQEYMRKVQLVAMIILMRIVEEMDSPTSELAMRQSRAMKHQRSLNLQAARPHSWLLRKRLRRLQHFCSVFLDDEAFLLRCITWD